jgi:hypothetical protein
MQISSMIGLIILSCLLESCATRLSCDAGAPKLPLVRPQPLRSGSQQSRVTSYIAGCTRKAFTVTEVTSVLNLPSCGMDLMATLFTLGVVPHAAPQPMQATVVGRVDGQTVTRTYRIAVERHTSLWHAFVPTSCDDRVIARAVLQAIDSGREVAGVFRRNPQQ